MIPLSWTVDLDFYVLWSEVLQLDLLVIYDLCKQPMPSLNMLNLKICIDLDLIMPFS